MAKFDPTRLPAKKEKVAGLLSKVLTAESTLRKAHFDDWRKLIDSYRLGVEKPSGERGLAIISASIDALRPHIFHNDPSIFAKPRNPSELGEEKQKAKLTQAALMYEWEEGGFNNECKKILWL